MRRSAAAMVLLVLPTLFLATAGCGRGGPELGRVTGTVTLDGTPLAGARIEFQPQAQDTSPSYGTTDRLRKSEVEAPKTRPGSARSRAGITGRSKKSER